MRRSLAPHAQTRAPQIAKIDAVATRTRPAGLDLEFVVAGDIAALAIPRPAPVRRRADDLWRTTCFEAFVKGTAGPGYLEINLSPSGEWAVYRFSGRRQGMTPAEVAMAPHIDIDASDRTLRLRARLDVTPSAGLPADGDWRLGLSAVIETAAGEVSFWALAHPPGPPDFHHPDCFDLQLPAAFRA